jgi:phospholipid/cholesterol/gamma-HCH transport system ATP-binding protein
MDVSSDRPPLVEFRRVSKAFGRQRVLDDLDISIQRGKTTVIIGRSGTGKSVLLKHIVGLLRPDRGEVFVNGQRVDTLPERQLVPIRRRISFIFQLNALFDSMTVGDNVAFPMVEGTAGRLDRAKIKRLVEESLAIVGLSGFENKRPAELSGGEKKRVAIARGIALDPAPELILYDEPTAGLDPQRSDVINRLIRGLQAETQATSIVVTHDMKLATTVGDRILMLWNGRIAADGTPEQLQKSDNEHVMRFIQGVAEPEDLKAL